MPRIGLWRRCNEADKALAVWCARCPLSLNPMEYEFDAGMVTYAADKTDGPTPGQHPFEATAFIARLVAHMPGKGHAQERFYAYDANRARA
jgi:hypothetical protein